MGAGVHRVRRQQWQVSAATPAQAFAIRTWLHDHCDGPLRDTLAMAFDRAAPGDEIVRLRRLIVQLRVSDITRIAEALPAGVIEALPAAVTALAVDGIAPPPPTAGAADTEQLIAYVLSGGIPWPSRPHAPSAVPALEAIAARSAIEVAAALAQRLTDRRELGTAMFRLLQLVDEKEWAAVIEAAGGSRRVLVALTASETRVSTDPLAGARGASDRRLRLVTSRLGSSNEIEPTPSGLQPQEGRVISAEPAGGSTPAEEHPHTKQLSSDAKTDHIRLRPQLNRGGAPGAVTTQEKETATASLTSFPIAVAHAGLVLLHPFLPQLFAALGIDLRAALPDESSQLPRAAAALHYAATGVDAPFELEFGLIKVLLGLTPETALPAGTELLSQADRDEVHALIRAAIEHWSALRQTSIDAVRTSFLQRPGLLRADENGWRLHVEPGPYDVLLKRLPWSCALVKLPWMDTPLHCEWPTP